MKYALIILILAVALAGCDEESQQQVPEQTTPDTGSQGEDTIPSAPTETLPDTQGGDVVTELTQLMKNQMNMNYHVDYEATISGSGTPSMDMQMSYYMQGVTRMRVDVNSFGIESRSYVMDGKYVSCTNMMNNWNCMEYVADDDYMDEYEIGTIDDRTIDEVFNSQVTRLPPRTIAGQLSSCFRTVQDEYTIDYCYTADGIPTYIRTLSDSNADYASETEMIATRVSKTLPAGTFELPVAASSYDNMDIDAIMDQYGWS